MLIGWADLSNQWCSAQGNASVLGMFSKVTVLCDLTVTCVLLYVSDFVSGVPRAARTLGMVKKFETLNFTINKKR